MPGNETFGCPLCGRQIAAPHVKRHLLAHDRRGGNTAASDVAWIRWLERNEQISSADAAAVAKRVEERHKVTR